MSITQSESVVPVTISPYAVDRTGQRKGSLVAVRPAGRYRNGNLLWLFRCDCGNYRESLWKTTATSCGCTHASPRKKATRPREGVWANRRKCQIEADREYSNRNFWSRSVLSAYGNRCEKCGWSSARCDVHHRVPKSQGGKNTISNGIVLCPNCHREQHEASAQGRSL